MGAFKDLLDVLRASVNGLIPLGGTLNPVSEGVPIAFAQNISGASYPLATIAQLADIPYQNLQLGMEVRILADGNKYKLIQLPAAGTKVSDVGGYVITDYWQVVDESGSPGAPGANGWSPLYTLEDDGPTRVVEKFFGWVGGTGSPPASPSSPNDYRGSSGFVAKSSAINVKGPQGLPGSAAQVRPEYYVSNGSRRLSPPVTNFPVGAMGAFYYGSGVLEISNLWTENRRFMIFGEIPVSNDSGSDSWAIRLLRRSANNYPTSAVDGGNIIIDENYSRADFVNASPYPAVHKINVRGMILLAPNASVYIRMAITQTNGGLSKVDDGFLEAFGL